MPKLTEVEGVVIAQEGERRAAYDVARDFVRQQAEGEWGDEIEERDARRLAAVLKAYADAALASQPD